MQDDLVSVIIPVYNVEKWLTKCLKSVIGQTYANIEILLIDDGSTDGTSAICDNYAKKDDRIKVIHIANGGGVAAARNTGLNIAKGKWIVFVDGDDWLTSNSIEVLHSNAIKRQAQYVVGRSKLILPGRNSFDKVEELEINSSCPDNDDSVKFFGALSYYSFPWKKIFRADIIKDNSIRFPVGMKVSEDTAFNLKYLCFCEKAISIDTVVYNYNCLRANGSASHYYPERSYWAKECMELYSIAIKRYVSSNEKSLAMTAKYACLRIQRDIEQHRIGCSGEQFAKKAKETLELLGPYTDYQNAEMPASILLAPKELSEIPSEGVKFLHKLRVKIRKINAAMKVALYYHR